MSCKIVMTAATLQSLQYLVIEKVYHINQIHHESLKLSYTQISFVQVDEIVIFCIDILCLIIDQRLIVVGVIDVD